MAHKQEPESHTFGPDTKAAFLGLIIGAIVLFGLVRTIVSLTNAKYAQRKAGRRSDEVAASADGSEVLQEPLARIQKIPRDDDVVELFELHAGHRNLVARIDRRAGESEQNR